MNKLYIIFAFLALLSCPAWVAAQRSDADCAEITLSTDTVDLGKMHVRDNVIRKVTIKNTGKCPLIIHSAEGVPVREFIYKKTFYQPGDTGTLLVEYIADKPGPVMQTLTIYSNARVKAKPIYIKGEVLTEEICAQLAFDKDTLNLGNIPYVFGKHFVLHLYNTGKCPMNFTVQGGDELLNLLDYTHTPLKPGDTGTVEIHLGGQTTGKYNGVLKVISANIPSGEKTLFIKAELLPEKKQ